MFILRQINKEGLESNMCLGNRYSITYKEQHPVRFKELLGVTVTHPDQGKIFAIVSFDQGSDDYPIYEGQSYYIMTESGRTFDNIKKR